MFFQCMELCQFASFFEWMEVGIVSTSKHERQDLNQRTLSGNNNVHNSVLRNCMCGSQYIKGRLWGTHTKI